MLKREKLLTSHIIPLLLSYMSSLSNDKFLIFPITILVLHKIIPTLLCQGRILVKTSLNKHEIIIYKYHNGKT